MRTSAPTSLPASSRKTALRAVCASSRAVSDMALYSLMFDDGSNLDGAATGPGFCHVQRLVKVGDIYLDIASDDLVAFKEGTIGDIGLPIRCKSHAGRCVRRLELPGTANFA